MCSAACRGAPRRLLRPEGLRRSRAPLWTLTRNLTALPPAQVRWGTFCASVPCAAVSRCPPVLQPAAHARRAPWGCAKEAHSRWHVSNLGFCVRRRPAVIMPCTCSTGPETGWRACGLQARAASVPAPGRAAWSPTPLQAAAVHAPPGTPLLRRRRTHPHRVQASAAPPAGRARAPTQMAAAAARRRPRTALPRASP